MGQHALPARGTHGAGFYVATWDSVYAEVLEKMGQEERERGVTPDDNVVALMAAMAGPSYPSADAALFLQVRSAASVSRGKLVPPRVVRVLSLVW